MPEPLDVLGRGTFSPSLPPAPLSKSSFLQPCFQVFTLENGEVACLTSGPLAAAGYSFLIQVFHTLEDELEISTAPTAFA